MPMLPYHQPRTGLEAKYSIEYDLATIALDGRAGLHQYSDDAVSRPAAQDLLTRVRYVPVEGDLREIKLESHVVLTLKDGTRLEESAQQSHGNPQDPLSEEEVAAKFHECAEALGARTTAPRHHGSLLPTRRSGERARTGRRGGFDRGLARPARHLRIEPMRSTGRLRSD